MERLHRPGLLRFCLRVGACVCVYMFSLNEICRRPESLGMDYQRDVVLRVAPSMKHSFTPPRHASEHATHKHANKTLMFINETQLKEKGRRERKKIKYGCRIEESLSGMTEAALHKSLYAMLLQSLKNLIQMLEQLLLTFHSYILSLGDEQTASLCVCVSFPVKENRDSVRSLRHQIFNEEILEIDFCGFEIHFQAWY